ncbi:MAG: aminoacyl-tRNA hydrolase [Myxococcales bacterium]|nr:aminoacyl-tRNA hydrolase [Myxococcales bacterium]
MPSSAPVHLVVGLGNPGSKYAGNRHNVGFLVIDHLAQRWAVPASREKFKSHFARATFDGHDVVLQKPETFMNRSGEAVQPAAAFFKVEPRHVLVIHDELDIPAGDLRIKVGGGIAGHNGLRSIVASLGTPDFVRLRVGIGRPPVGDVHHWVLGDFSAEERIDLVDRLDRAADAVEACLTLGPTQAMQRIHTKSSKT